MFLWFGSEQFKVRTLAKYMFCLMMHLVFMLTEGMERDPEAANTSGFSGVQRQQPEMRGCRPWLRGQRSHSFWLSEL